MTVNLPFPFALEIQYSVNFLNHKKLLPIILQDEPEISTPFNEIFAVQRDEGVMQLNTAVEDYLELVVPFWGASMSVGDITLWKYSDEDLSRTFVSAYVPTANAGLAILDNVDAACIIFTYRTNQGGIFKDYFLEQIDGSSFALNYANLDELYQDYIDAMLSNNNVFVGRDNGYPISFRLAFFGQNEALFKKRFRLGL